MTCCHMFRHVKQKARPTKTALHATSPAVLVSSGVAVLALAGEDAAEGSGCAAAGSGSGAAGEALESLTGRAVSSEVPLAAFTCSTQHMQQFGSDAPSCMHVASAMLHIVQECQLLLYMIGHGRYLIHTAHLCGLPLVACLWHQQLTLLADAGLGGCDGRLQVHTAAQHDIRRVPVQVCLQHAPKSWRCMLAPNNHGSEFPAASILTKYEPWLAVLSCGRPAPARFVGSAA